jgi:hypothetical protein
MIVTAASLGPTGSGGSSTIRDSRSTGGSIAAAAVTTGMATDPTVAPWLDCSHPGMLLEMWV